MCSLLLSKREAAKNSVRWLEASHGLEIRRASFAAMDVFRNFISDFQSSQCFVK